MAINLLDILKQIFGGDFTKLAAGFLGESEANTKSAVTSMLPALLGAIVQKGSTADGASSLFNAISSPQVDANLAGSVSQLLGGGGSNVSSLVTAGSSIISSLLGPKAGAMTSALSSMSGISGSSATSLMSLAAPLIFSGLKKVVGDGGLNASSLMSLLGSQSKALESAIDPRLGQAMNLRLPNVAQAATAAADTAAGGLGKLMPWIMAAIAALIALWLFRSCSAADTAQKTADAAKAAAASAAQKTADATKATTDAAKAAAQKTADAAKAAAQKTADAGRSVVAAVRSIDLPGGVKIDAPQGGFIDTLVTFVSKPDWVSGKSFAFDAVTFETNSATLAQLSAAQLTQLATVLKAFPLVIVSVEGHTDNTGDPAANKKLSEDRAAAVKAALVGMGMPADRVASVGWGQDKPVASNDTEAGKLQNRRVEITLLKK